MKLRTAIAALTLSAGGFVGILLSEGYSDTAIIPVQGDVPTIGFGTTGGVRPGDRITPPQAVVRAHRDVVEFEERLKGCVSVPLYQHEYDAFVSLAYNIGIGAFCRSTLVRKLNAEDYIGACLEILRWDKFKGQTLRGLSLRREREYRQCVGLRADSSPTILRIA